jgi:glycosyltransferase involved in cell wall biosynthesis
MSKQSPLVSIITPSYNQGTFIEATILSVLEQDYPNIEYLVVDGASTDETQEVLRRYRGRLRWISEPDSGQAHAINKGFAHTRGEILGWLNSDDTYLPGAISAAVEYLVAHPDVMLVYGNANFMDANGAVIGPCAHVEPFDLNRLIHHSDFIVQPATFFRRSAFESVGGLDESLHWAMDYDLWLKMGHHYKVAYFPRLMANSRWFGANKTAIGGLARLAEIEKVARRHGSRGLPAYFCLEAVALNGQEAWQAARRLDVGRAGTCLARAATALVSSRLAIWSLILPKTWRIIGTRQNRGLTTQR